MGFTFQHNNNNGGAKKPQLLLLHYEPISLDLRDV